MVGQGTHLGCLGDLEYLEYLECLAANLRFHGSQDTQGTQRSHGR